MSETRSSQYRQPPVERESSATKVRVILPRDHSLSADGADNDATIISTRTPGFDSGASTPRLKPLEVGKLLEGEQLGQFELRQFVGGGGMGVVFRGWDTTLNREVAVKVLSRDQSVDDEMRRRFRNEAQSAARLDHDNIARVHYVGEDRGVHYIVFEFIEGVNLRDLVTSKGPLPVDEALDYTLQIAEALDHASQRDVIHRDIKPSNVLITGEGKAKLVDMGLARLHQVEQTDDDLTASGVTLGTFDYISPEQARDPRSADVRSDLYSLGCSLYFMLVGQPPFPNGTVLQKLLQHQGDEAADPRTLRPNLPADVVQVIKRLLAKTPAQRYQLPTDLIAEVAAIRARLAHQPISPIASGWKPARSPARWRRHLPWAVPLAALVLISMGLDFYWSNVDDAAEIKVPDSLNSAPRTKVSQGASPVSMNGENAGSAVASVPDRKKPPEINDSGPKDPVTNDGGSVDGAVPEKVAVPQRSVNPGSLIVGDLANGANFISLGAACRAAHTGDVIELRYSGRREEPPLSIGNIKLTVRAAEGFSPVITFRPGESDLPSSPQSMITVAGGSVNFIDVALELKVPKESAAEALALFDIREANLVRLEHCSITIHNPSADQASPDAHVTFFSIEPRAGFERTSPDGDGKIELPVQASPVALELLNSLARGEATFLRVADGQSVRLNWDNGILAISERMLVANAGRLAARRGARIDVEARHLTVDTRGGLAWFDFTDRGLESLAADLRLAGSIVRVRGDVPLIEQVGSILVSDGDGPVVWTGDRNFYEGVGVFWKSHDTNDPSPGQQMNFSEWRSFWGQQRENLPYMNSVLWLSSAAKGRPVHACLPSDYALSNRSANNPARDSASDGLDAGCLLNLLPALPPVETEETFGENIGTSYLPELFPLTP